MSLVLVIDDDPKILQLLDAVRSCEGHRSLLARDGKEGLALMTQNIDLVITDLLMPNMEGLETIAQIRKCGWTTPVIAMSGGGAIGPRSYLETARLIGASAVLAKPFAQDELHATVRSLLIAPVLS